MDALRIRDLVLVCGFSRSGTTWLAKILDSRPSVYLRSEPDKRSNSSLILGGVPHCVDTEHANWVKIYQEGIKELLIRSHCNLSSFPFFEKEYIAVPHRIYWTLSLAGYALDYLINRSGKNLIALPRVILRSRAEVDLVWKSVNQSANLDFLQKAFPNIKIVYLLRNPYAVLTSTVQNERMSLDGEDHRRILERQDAPFFKANPIDLHAVEQWPEIKKRALRWRIDCESAVISGRHAGNLRLLLYEDLVSDPLVAVEDLFGWIGWEMDQQTVTFLMQSTGRCPPPTYARIFSKGYFGVYRRPGGNVTGWETKISHQDYELMSSVLRDSPLLSFWPTHLTSKADF